MSDNRPRVYIIRHEHGYVKIGESNDPEARLKQFQTATPHELELWIVVHVEWKSDERTVQDEFADCRTKGEWFDVSENVVIRRLNRLLRETENGVVAYTDEITDNQPTGSGQGGCHDQGDVDV